MSDNPNAPEKPTILLVDDTSDNIALLTLLLRGTYKTKVATNGPRALEVAQAESPPDLILLDIMMPDMDGFEVCRRMKESDTLRDIPIIFLSALTETTDKVKAFNAGGVDYITKPFQGEEVRARVSTHLKIRRLQAELEEQNRKIQESYDKLSQLTAQKDEFIRIASHDLKNPLMCVLGFATIIEETLKSGGGIDESTQSFVSKIVESAQLMQKIIEDFLDFNALEDGQLRLNFEPMELNQTAVKAVEQNQAYADSKSIPISLELAESLPVVSADANRIRQVVENLVSNAIKFSTAGSPVIVRTRAAEEGVTTEVIDSGPGLSDEDMGKLFVKYAKLSNKPTGGEKSSGLGLAICKQLIEMHGGRVGVRNNPEAGATFWFSLPARHSA